MSPSPILSPFDEAEERLTQPDAEADKAEAIDSDEEEEHLLTQPDADADLDAQLKQVSTFNANDSLLHAATEDNESKKAIKYYSMPVLGKKSSKWWEGFEQLVPSTSQALHRICPVPIMLQVSQS